MKLLILLTLSLFTSCINLASPVTYVVIIKPQFGDGSMTGSQLEKIAEGMTQEAGDVKLPTP